eukprot:SM000101S09232  [mRNA]  locus=s101:52083:55608:+ [translate_table: standard]
MAAQSFEELGLSEWLAGACRQLGMRSPTAVQAACIPAVLAGRDVVGAAETGSGKTAAFALPILQRLGQDPYGVFALFRALGAAMRLRDAVVVGGMDLTRQALQLAQRPHVVIATPGRLRDLLENHPDMVPTFAHTRFLVLDEADRLLEPGFESELRLILQSLPPKRQTLLFSATMTFNLRALQDLSLGKSAYKFEVKKGFHTVQQLRQEYLFIPANVKEVYLAHIMGLLEDMAVRSVIVFASTCRSAHLLGLLLEELGITSISLHSLKTQGRRLAALDRFKSGLVPILIATDVASRGLDIPTVDLVINYDIPRYARDYVHRVGRTARAGRGGLAISLITQFDVELAHQIEGVLHKRLEEHELNEDLVLKGITKVFKAKRVALLKMAESGFDDLVKARKDAKLLALKRKGVALGLVKRVHRNKAPHNMLTTEA